METSVRLGLSLVEMLHRAPGRLSKVEWARLLLLLGLFSTTSGILPFPSLTPAIPQFFYNGTFASQRCQNKFTCGSVGSDISECSCHSKCALFDECCADVRPTNWSQLKLPADAYECTTTLVADSSAANGNATKVTGLVYIYVITKCPPTFNGALIREVCEGQLNRTGSGAVPPLVTDSSTGLTYGNMFCAFCNGVKPSLGVSWASQNVCLDQPPLGLTGCQQRWIKPNNVPPLADCFGSVYYRECPPNSRPSLQAACTDSPVKRFYDANNKVVFRNYNCSLCYSIENPNWACNRWSVGFGTAPDAGLQALLAVYDCPKQLTTFATQDERKLWTAACPGITFNRGNCSDTLSSAALLAMYSSNPTDDYDINLHGVWVRYNASYTACASCQLSNHSAEAVGNTSHFENSNPGNITLDGITYSLPFFKLATGAGGYMTCSAAPFDGPKNKCTALPSVVSQVLMALSLLGLGLYAVAYGLLQSLRNLPGQIVLHQSAAFFVGFLLFMLRLPAGVASDGACMALGVLSHFFFLAAFTWTAVYAVEVVRALGFQAYGAGFTKRRLRYSIVGWLVPVLIIIAAVATDWGTHDNDFRPAYGRPQCFINSSSGQRIFFTAPLALCLLIDVLIYVYVIIRLVIISRQTKMVRDAHHEKLFLAIKLVFALGTTWIFAVLASATGDCTLVYIFELLNSMQGLFVFLIFVCNAKTSGQLHKKVTAHKSITSLAGTGLTLSSRDSLASGVSIVSRRKSVLGVKSFSPVSLAMDARENESNPPQ